MKDVPLTLHCSSSFVCWLLDRRPQHAVAILLPLLTVDNRLFVSLQRVCQPAVIKPLDIVEQTKKLAKTTNQVL